MIRSELVLDASLNDAAFKRAPRCMNCNVPMRPFISNRSIGLYIHRLVYICDGCGATVERIVTPKDKDADCYFR